MSVSGICSYCSQPAQATCTMCGQAICPEHTAGGGDTCLSCLRGQS